MYKIFPYKSLTYALLGIRAGGFKYDSQVSTRKRGLRALWYEIRGNDKYGGCERVS